MNVERLRPKRLDRLSSRSFENSRNDDDKCSCDRALRGPLRELLGGISKIFREDTRYEDAYEDSREAVFEFVDEDFCIDGVPMAIGDGLAGLLKEKATFRI